MTGRVRAAAAVVGLVACGGGHSPSGVPATTRPTTTTMATTAAPAPTTSSVAAVVAGGSSPEDAAGHLLAAWKAGDRAAALTEADRTAVDSLFARPYPSAGFQARGCDQNPNASNCFYRIGDNGLNLHTVHAPVGWRVDAAQLVQ
ncbi:MAG TPA: hypothetical protein VF954_05300 [Acidimicrobiales bacterium]